MDEWGVSADGTYPPWHSDTAEKSATASHSRTRRQSRSPSPTTTTTAPHLNHEMALTVVIALLGVLRCVVVSATESMTLAPGWIVEVDFGPEAASCPSDTGPWPDFTVLTLSTGLCQRHNHTHSWQRTCVEKAALLEEYDNMDCEGVPHQITRSSISQTCSLNADGQGYSATYCEQLPQQVAGSKSHRLIIEMYHQDDPNCNHAIATWYTIPNRCVYEDGYWFSTNQDASGVQVTRFNTSDCTPYGNEVDVIDVPSLGQCTPWYLPDHTSIIFAFARVYVVPAGTSMTTSMSDEKNHSETSPPECLHHKLCATSDPPVYLVAFCFPAALLLEHEAWVAGQKKHWSTTRTVAVSVCVTVVVMLGLFAAALVLLRLKGANKGPTWSQRRDMETSRTDEAGSVYELLTTDI